MDSISRQDPRAAGTPSASTPTSTSTSRSRSMSWAAGSVKLTVATERAGARAAGTLGRTGHGPVLAFGIEGTALRRIGSPGITSHLRRQGHRPVVRFTGPTGATGA